MGRRVRSAPLETRTARLRLAVRADPYFVALGGGLHLGYRRRASGGSWLARARGEDSRYREEGIGLADDNSDADGVSVLTFGEAQRKAQAWGGTRREAEAGGVKVGARYTVADAMREYLADYKVRGKGLSQTTHVINTKIIPSLGNIPLSKLTVSQGRRWHSAIAAAPSMKRGGQPRKVVRGHEDAQRRRRASANRALTVLKAALNFAFNHDRAGSNAAWTKLRPFRDVESPVVRFFSEAEAARLTNAADQGFRNLLHGALLTGCRYGELVRLKCGDVNTTAQTVAVREAKGGKPRHVFLTDEGARFFAQMIAGRPREAHVFQRAIGREWRKSEQLRPMALACERANIKPAVGFHVLRHTHGSWLAQKGVPLQVIAAQLGHADIRMTEKHYAHLLPSYVSQTIRANLPELGIKTGRVATFDRPMARR